MTRDTLFLLRPDFEDPAYPGQRFYCWHCALLEGVLAAFPALAARLDVERVAWPRPRLPVIALTASTMAPVSSATTRTSRNSIPRSVQNWAVVAMLTSLVRPERISSPITRRPAVTR